jgi:hypothetical protein
MSTLRASSPQRARVRRLLASPSMNEASGRTVRTRASAAAAASTTTTDHPGGNRAAIAAPKRPPPTITTRRGRSEPARMERSTGGGLTGSTMCTRSNR